MSRIVRRIVLIAGLFVLSILYIYPVLQGLVLLPLDLLVSNYSPWHWASTILLKNPYMQDSIMQLYPWRHLAVESLTHGIIPFWNPYQLTGVPFMASMKPMVWYPLNLLIPFGEVAVWHALLLFQIFGSLFFMYLFTRDLGLRRLPSVLAGISFAFSSLMVGVLEFGSDGNALLWLPLLLFLTKRFVDHSNGIYLLLLGLSTAFAVFAGHLQYLGYELLIVFLFLFVYGRSVRSKQYIYLYVCLALSLGIGMSAVQMIPSLEMFRFSVRGMENSYSVFVSDLLKPYHLFRLFSPDFFGHPLTGDLHISYIEQSGYFGIIPLFFALYAILFVRKDHTLILFKILFFVGVLFSLDGIAQIIYFLRIPVISSGSGERIFFMTEAMGAVLSAYGISDFFDTGNEIRKNWSVIIYGILVLLLFGISHGMVKVFHWEYPKLDNFKFSAIILGLFIILIFTFRVTGNIFRRLRVPLFILTIIALTYFDLFRLGYRFLTFSNPKFLYPDNAVLQFINSKTNSTMARVYGALEPELPSYFGIYTSETYNSFYPERTETLLNALQGKSEHLLNGNKYELHAGPRLKKTLNFLGTSLIVAPKGELPSKIYFYNPDDQADLTKIFGDDRLEVYSNRAADPRFGLFYNVQSGVSEDDILDNIAKGQFDSRSILLLEETIPDLKTGSGSAVLVSSDLNSQLFRIDSTEPALLYVSDAYYPGWQAWVNGIQSHIYRANYNFRAVLVPRGNSEVRFLYRPSWWDQSVAVSFGSLIVLMIVSFSVQLKYRRQ